MSLNIVHIYNNFVKSYMCRYIYALKEETKNSGSDPDQTLDPKN